MTLQSLDYRFAGVRVGRILIGVAVAVFQLVSYQILLQYNSERLRDAELWNITTALDDALPLIPGFAFIYFLYIPGLIVPALLDMPMHLFVRYAVAMVVSICISLLGFALFPVALVHDAFSCQEFTCAGLHLLRDVDPGVNLLPSLHASQTLLAGLVLYLASKRYAVRSFWWFWIPALYLPVIASTLLTKQHVIIDIFAGFGVGVLAWYASRHLMGNADAV